MKFLQKGSPTIKSGKRTKPIDKPSNLKNSKKAVQQPAMHPAPNLKKSYALKSRSRADDGIGGIVKRSKTPGSPSSPRGSGSWLS